MKNSIIILCFSFCCSALWGQSFEIMLGDKRIFADVQWLKFVDSEKRVSLFSRTRATLDYDNQSDIFSGAYLNYTSKIGLGGSLVGKISNSGGAVDAGLHIFKATSNWMLFGLVSIGLQEELQYSWFSIFRFTPKLNKKWRLYSSLELYHLFGQGSHVFSVQRIRLGLDYQQFQFGVAGNFSEIGTDWTGQSNLGGFIRKSF